MIQQITSYFLSPPNPKIYPLFNIERKIGQKASQIYITSWNCGFGWQKVVFFGTEIEEGMLKTFYKHYLKDITTP